MPFDHVSSRCGCPSADSSGDSPATSPADSLPPAPEQSGLVYRNIDQHAMNWIVAESLYFDGNTQPTCSQQNKAPGECSSNGNSPAGYASAGYAPENGQCASYPPETYPSSVYPTGPSPIESSSGYPVDTYPSGGYPIGSDQFGSPAPVEVVPQPSNSGTAPEQVPAPGSQSQLSGSFPDYWSYRYPNGTAPSWDNTYAGSQFSSPLDNSSAIHYAQTYSVAPQNYAATGASGYYNQYTWQRTGPNGAFGGSTPFQLSPAELNYAAKRGE